MDKVINWLQDKLGIWGMIFLISLGVLLLLLFVKFLITSFTEIDWDICDSFVFFSTVPILVLILTLALKAFLLIWNFFHPFFSFTDSSVDKFLLKLFLKHIVICVATLAIDKIINLVIKICKNLFKKKT